MRWLDGITESIDMILSMAQEIVKNMETWNAAVHGVAESDSTDFLVTEQQQQHDKQILGICFTV